MKTPNSNLTRREFGRLSLLAAGTIALPNIIPARLRGASAPSNRVRVGHIGCGRIGRDHDMPSVFHSGLADIVAVCDLDSKRAADGKKRVEGLHAEKGTKPSQISVFGDYRELLARKDIDAVAISTPDHWHAELALAAVYAGKDVYLQKPMTMTHAEGILLRTAVEKTGRIFQLGSQQRCNYSQFRKACEMVRSGRVGRVKRVEIGLPIDPTAPDDAPQPVPANLDYERWLGPTANASYTEQRVHPQKGYGRPGWLRNDAYCLGMITGWGAHHYDILHWALDCELGGPSRIEGKADFPKNKIWNVHGAYNIHLTYPGGVDVRVSDKFPNGLKFIGDEGWIFVSRGSVSVKDPAVPKGRLRPLDASNDKLIDPKGVTVELPRSEEHHLNWLECVRSRKTPLVPAPVAHRGNAACIVSWIAMKLGRPLTWDPKAEKFVGDAEANAMLARPEREPYGATRLAAKRGRT
ncbi:MAG: Gfo/Idh/MocA family oxidoreductase [Opitutaceae bacterium]|nr:Gfo/Idh/MocA family oxidoreductase [Opitutaceae bacterium]